jgi:hypothetical protein
MTDLTDRMRTCAAYIMNRPHDAPMPSEHLLDDAADLLIQASNELAKLEPSADMGEPMDIIPSAPPGFTIDRTPSPAWTTTPADSIPPPVSGPPSARRLNTCPKCDSRAIKTVRREGRQMMIACPVCAHEWPYSPSGRWT